MAVVKLSSSGKAVQFVLNEADCIPGAVFQLSRSLFGGIMSNSINGPYVVLTRLESPAGVNQFPVSPVWSPGKGKVEAAKSSAGVHGSFSKEFLSERKEQKVQSKVDSFNVEW